MSEYLEVKYVEAEEGSPIPSSAELRTLLVREDTPFRTVIERVEGSFPWAVRMYLNPGVSIKDNDFYLPEVKLPTWESAKAFAENVISSVYRALDRSDVPPVAPG